MIITLKRTLLADRTTSTNSSLNHHSNSNQPERVCIPFHLQLCARQPRVCYFHNEVSPDQPDA